MGRSSNVVKAKDEVIDVDVINNADENLGKIIEVMLDKTSGRVAYVVLESGSFLGMGGKLFALPWNILHYDDKKDCFKVDIDEERLKSAPGFDKDHWPDMTDNTWATQIFSYYKIKPYWE